MDPELARLRQVTADRVALAETMPVGPVLVAELYRLRGEPMTASTAVDVQALWGKVESWVVAERMLPTHEAVHGVRGMLDLSAKDEAQMLTAQEIACATHVAYATAMDHVALVERVAQSLGHSWQALDRGEVTFAQVKAVERCTRNCTPRVAAAVDEKVIALAVARGWTPSETARAARRMVIALDPEGAKDRAAAAKDSADVQLYPGEDETATLSAHGDAVLSREMMDTINDQAEQMGRAGDDRTVGVRRFHALYNLLLGTTASGTSAVRPVTRGTTLTHIDLATLLGANDHPGELVGYGPITADTARALAADSMLRRLVTDPLTGDTLDLGLTAYRPSAALRRLIEATYPTCTMPGCSRPSIQCEIDHRHERHDGGRTDRCNLEPLCKMHHQLKTKERWRLDIEHDRTQVWTSYLGRTYTKTPTHFPMPEPLPPEDNPPEDIANRIPELVFDPYPSGDEPPLPEPPPLTREEYQEMETALDNLAAFGETFQQWCDRHYDQARATGLVA